MRISAFYYLQYPDYSPADPRDAATELYVEVGGPDSTHDKFEKTFSFQVYTVENLRKAVARDGFLAARSVLVIDELKDEAVRSVLERVLERIEELGTRVG